MILYRLLYIPEKMKLFKALIYDISNILVSEDVLTEMDLYSHQDVSLENHNARQLSSCECSTLIIFAQLMKNFLLNKLQTVVICLCNSL